MCKKHLAVLEEAYPKQDIDNHFGFVSSMLVSYLLEERKRQEEVIFLDLIESKKLLLAVSDNPAIGYTVPDSDVITVDRQPNTYKYYLFEDLELSSMNSLEQKVGDLLDKQERICGGSETKLVEVGIQFKDGKNMPSTLILLQQNVPQMTN
jgi:type III restriction enzyme